MDGDLVTRKHPLNQDHTTDSDPLDETKSLFVNLEGNQFSELDPTKIEKPELIEGEHLVINYKQRPVLEDGFNDPLTIPRRNSRGEYELPYFEKKNYAFNQLKSSLRLANRIDNLYRTLKHELTKTVVKISDENRVSGKTLERVKEILENLSELSSLGLKVDQRIDTADNYLSDTLKYKFWSKNPIKAFLANRFVSKQKGFEKAYRVLRHGDLIEDEQDIIDIEKRINELAEAVQKDTNDLEKLHSSSSLANVKIKKTLKELKESTSSLTLNEEEGLARIFTKKIGEIEKRFHSRLVANKGDCISLTSELREIEIELARTKTLFDELSSFYSLKSKFESVSRDFGNIDISKFIDNEINVKTDENRNREEEVSIASLIDQYEQHLKARIESDRDPKELTSIKVDASQIDRELEGVITLIEGFKLSLREDSTLVKPKNVLMAAELINKKLF